MCAISCLASSRRSPSGSEGRGASAHHCSNPLSRLIRFPYSFRSVRASEPLQEIDELPDLHAVAFVSAEHISEDIEDDEAWFEVRHMGVERIIHWRRLNLAFHE